jgi:hypothetical protein
MQFCNNLYVTFLLNFFWKNQNLQNIIIFSTFSFLGGHFGRPQRSRKHHAQNIKRPCNSRSRIEDTGTHSGEFGF